MTSLCAATLPLVIFGAFGIAVSNFSSRIHVPTTFVDSSAWSAVSKRLGRESVDAGQHPTGLGRVPRERHRGEAIGSLLQECGVLTHEPEGPERVRLEVRPRLQ
jgi:hypothetical protein